MANVSRKPNWSKEQSMADRPAYINKNTDMDDPRIAELAHAAEKAALAMMKDMKNQGLIFMTEDSQGKPKQAKAVVKVEPALDKQNGREVVFQGKKEMDYPPKLDKNGNQIYNINVSIYHGAQNLTLFGSQQVNADGKLDFTQMRWSHFNRNNPKNSPSAVGNEEIQASKASPELKALADAIDKGEYIKDWDVAISTKTKEAIEKAEDKQTGKQIATLAYVAKLAVKPMVADMKKQDVMPYLTSKAGNQYKGNAYISITPRLDKDTQEQTVDSEGNKQFWVQAVIRKDNDSLVIFGTPTYENGMPASLNLNGMKFSQFNEESPADSLNIMGNANIQASDAVPAEFKKLAQAIEDGGYIEPMAYSELRQFAYELNTEVFHEKVMVDVTDKETGETSKQEKRLLNASYSAPTEKEDGSGMYPESVMIFNKAQPEILVKLTDTEDYGHTVAAINTAFTQVEDGVDENGKVHYKTVEKTDPNEKSAFLFINTAEDVADFLPNLPELHEAIARFMPDDISLESIRDAIGDVAPADIDNISETTEQKQMTDENGKAVEVDGFDAGQIDDFIPDDFGDFESIDDGDVPF